MKVDIIGAGFGGISAASTIKQLSPQIDVIIHEKYDKIGYNPDGRRCGEAHTVKGEWGKWRPQEKSIFNRITKGEVFFDDKKICYYEKPDTGFILNRPEFLKELGEHALDLGVKIQTNNPISSISELDGTYIIDASGSRNQFKKELGLKRGLCGISYQETISEYPNYCSDTIKIFWMKENGYIWIFPRDKKTKEINVGIGFFRNCKQHLNIILNEFKKAHNIPGVISHKTSGLIPFGLQRPFKLNHVLFVGDTAVGTFPLSGQGIYRALISGDIAGKCIAKGSIDKYPYLITQAFMSREEIVGKTFLLLIEFLKQINPDFVMKITPMLFNASHSINRYSH